MKACHLSFLLVVVCICIPVICSAAEICPDGQSSRNCAIESYSWAGSTVVITEPGEYTFTRRANFPDDMSIEVSSFGVILDGSGVTLRQIIGKPDLDLKNITIFIDDPEFSDAAITECRNIVDSSISVTSESEISGIGRLYGTIDDTTSITVTTTGTFGNAYGVRHILDTGTISGGTFTVTSQEGMAFGIYKIQDDGTVSGGTFSIVSGEELTETSTNQEGVKEGVAFGIYAINGSSSVSGGEFTITSQNGMIFGIGNIQDNSTISGGTFTVTSQKGLAFGVLNIENDGIISDGTFTITSQEGLAFGVVYIQDNGAISGGKFTVTSEKSEAYGVFYILDNGTISNEEIFAVTSQEELVDWDRDASGTISGETFSIDGTSTAPLPEMTFPSQAILLISLHVSPFSGEEADSMSSADSLSSTDSLLQAVRFTVTYESEETVELTEEHAKFIVDEDILLCIFKPEKEGEYRLQVAPVARETFGFDAEMKVLQLEQDGMTPTISPTGTPTTTPRKIPTVTRPTMLPTNPITIPTAMFWRNPISTPPMMFWNTPFFTPPIWNIPPPPHPAPTPRKTSSPAKTATISPTATTTVSPPSTVMVSLTETATVSPPSTVTISPTATTTVSSTSTVTVSPTATMTVSSTSTATISPTTTQTPTTPAITYVFANVDQDHTIHVTFKKIPLISYTITPTHGENGSIDPATLQTIPEGETVTFIIEPVAGYMFDELLVDGESKTPTTMTPAITYVFTEVDQNHTIYVNFKRNEETQ